MSVCLHMFMYMCADHIPGVPKEIQEFLSIMCQAEATAAAN